MNDQNKCVLITGASAGIGEACAEQFAKLGMRLLLCARRHARLKRLATQLVERYGVDVHTFTLDVSDREAVSREFQQLPSHWQDIDILVNNAGLALGLDKVQEAKPQDWEIMLDVNIKGLLYVTQQVLQPMLANNRGHIINIGSIAAHQVYSGGVVYCATKSAVRAISDGIKMDVHGTSIRVSTVNPGMVETEFSNVRFAGDEERARSVYEGAEPLTAADIADVVVYCATRPAHVDVREVNVYPTTQTAVHMLERHK